MIKTLPWLGVFASVCVAPSASSQEAEDSALNEPAPMPEPEIVWGSEAVSQGLRSTDSPARLSATPRNNPGSWITRNDYPVRAIRELREGTVGYELVVGTNGRVTSCAITGRSGHQDLDERTCRLLQRRARFIPNRDSEGNPITGTYSGSVRWQLPKIPLPNAFFVKYEIVIGADGRVTSCEMQRASGEVPRPYTETVLCRLYSSQLYEIVPNESGVKRGKTLIVRHGIEVPAEASVE